MAGTQREGIFRNEAKEKGWKVLLRNLDSSKYDKGFKIFLGVNYSLPHL